MYGWHQEQGNADPACRGTVSDPRTGDWAKPLDARHRRALRASQFNGGSAVAYGYDYIALIQNRTPNARSVCTGSLISSTKVLTAGHCCYELQKDTFVDPARLIMLIGAHQLTNINIFGDLTTQPIGVGELRYVQTLTVPPPWSQQHDLTKDICILTLDTAVTDIAPATIAPANDTLPTGSRVFALGWGRQDGQIPTGLAGGYETTADCQSHGSGADFTLTYDDGSSTPAFLCYDASVSGACSGDSGGPMLVGSTIYGTVSRGYAAAGTPGYPCNDEQAYINLAEPALNAFILQS
ncbi:hypothetical protein WJX73_008175 [Symbiochloris irregularis]|uniref:Peptidase S1 domain-containing protein n=1 Tax=Symbiochloris irregularis TaxID=706552 RepID=A0AAW1NRF8_9CHLO